jgi:two-component system chemotaxis sensor kinase CheA
MSIDMSQFYQVFFEESEEHLATMESLLLGLDVDHPDLEQLNAIFRAAHSIKGSAGTFGFTDLAETTHILENLLDRIRKSELRLRADMVDAFLQAGDVLRGMLDAHQGRGAADPAAVAAVCERLRHLSDGDRGLPSAPVAVAAPVLAEQSGGASQRWFAIDFVPAAAALGRGIDNLLDELRGFGTLEVVDRPLPDDPAGGRWHLRLLTDRAQESFVDQVDFVAEAGAWRIADEATEAGEAFGFFEDSPGAPAALASADDGDGAYGFFASLAESAVAEEGDGFGFFAPLPTPAEAPATAGDEAYGFFEPLPATAAPVVEEGEGYGFFAPLPVPPAAEPLPARPAEVPVAIDKPAARVAKGAAAATDSSIRVSVEKVDQLINLVGELVITQAMLLQSAAQMLDAAPERLLNGLTQLERNTRDLQESVMSIRMMPISFVFSRFPRVVRDLSAKLGKQVELKTMGETTELDKSLIERIADPLTHLIRNSLDHGIEAPEKRVAAGKSPTGTITLKAYHQGGNIVIEVGDDGAGLPREKILQKARERGLPVSEQMSDQEVFNLIFEAGFSTAEQITDVSGRGVGMDVVRRNIQSMGGRVEIDSMYGIGTRMTVRLPLTLAILDGMSVAVGDQIYILPLSYVLESLQPMAGDIKTLTNQARVVQVRGEYLPVVVLHEMFGLKSAWNDFMQGIMVVLDADGARVALFVDALLGQHQVVIKSLEANYRKVPGISGATIMGDGHVALILDVSAIAGMARNHTQKAG